MRRGEECLPEKIGYRSDNFLTLTAVLLFFLVSGVCGLVYQVVWTRKLVLLFGSTSFAVSCVLSIFFLGLGLGSLWGGRIADLSRRWLLIYGVFEIVIGLWALLFIFMIDRGEGAVVAVLQWAGPSRVLGVALRAVMALAFLIVPVTLMGATLPLLSKFVTRGQPLRGVRIGVLYSLNTLGAVMGCALTGFVLLAHLGYTRATFVGAGLNIGVGIAALSLQRSPDSSEGAVREEAPQDGLEPLTQPVMGAVLCAFAVSGFCALALEVLWTRLLTLVFLGTTYAFTTMLTTVLCGIALGSAVAALLPAGHRRVALFGATLFLTGLACLTMLFLFPSLPGRYLAIRQEGHFEWGSIVFAKFWLSFGVLLLPTFFFGMSFPLAVKAAALGRERLGRDIGRLYSANTFGGVAGAVAGGFVLIPLLGAHGGIVSLSVLLCAMGLLLIQCCPGLAKGWKAGAAVLGTGAAAILAMALPGDVSVLLNESILPGDHRMIYYREGVEGTVVVSEPVVDAQGTGRVLWINAVQATASIEKGVKMNRFQGVLPFFFDRDPARALFMCFGSGITAGTLGLSPFERIDAVEISHTVLEAAHWFEADNFSVRENPLVHYIVDDGRNFLLTTKSRYGLISFEPMPLALAGVSTFYTEEYYRLCLARLNPGGLVSQWVPLHNGLDPAVVRDLVGTFVRVFPESTAWFVNADLFLIGSNAPLVVDAAKLDARLAANDRLREGLAAVSFGDVPELLASFFMGKENLARYTQDARLMTDDRPWAEFVAPRVVHQRNVPELLDILGPYRESCISLLKQEPGGGRPEVEAALDRRHQAHVNDFEGLKVYYTGGLGTEPEVYFRRSLDIDPADGNAKYYLAETLLQQGRLHADWAEFDKAIPMLIEARAHGPRRRDILLALADAYYDSGQPEEAAPVYQAYLELHGEAPRARERS